MFSFKRFCLVLAALAGFSATSAHAITATCAAGLNILNSGTTTCQIDNLTFTFNAPAFSPTSVGDSLTISSVGATAGDVSLLFAINPGTSGFPVDLNIDYSVTSALNNIDGIDASFPGGTDGSISEQACASQPDPGTLCSSANLLSHLDVTTGGVDMLGTPTTFGPVGSVFIHKDIDAVSFSEFTDSVELGAVPEPATWGLMIIAFLGLASMRRRSIARATA
jgi:hypothetical protein